MADKKYTIMLVDDEIDITEALNEGLEDEFEILTANSGEDAISKMSQHFDLIVCDMRMPGIQGYEVLQKVVAKDESIRRILLTGFADLEAAKAAIELGKIHRYESKPINLEKLKTVILEELENSNKQKAGSNK